MADLARIPKALPDDMPPPMMAGAMPSAPPDMGPPPAPMVSRIPTQGEQNIAHDEAKLQKVQWHQDNPWGTPENHPGKLGKVAHAFSTLGNIAGNIVAPNVMANIPQTQLGMKAEEGQLAKRVQQEQTAEGENQERQALTNKTNVDTGLEPGKVASEEGLQSAQTDEAKQRTTTAQESLINTLSHYVHADIVAGKDPNANPIVQQLQDQIANTKPAAAAKGLEHVSLMDPKTHQPAAAMFNPNTGKYYGQDGKEIANPTPYERPININTGNAELDREATRLSKPYEKGISDANAQLDKIADARAMVNGSAEAQALGIPKVLTALVSGQGSGVRITQAELNMIGKARGLSGDVEGTINSWAGKGKLSAQQQKELTGILDDVHQRIIAKQAIHNDTLDRINGASSREDIIRADKEARQKLSDLSQHGSEPARPANVPEGYKFNAAGPKGAGWYAPTAK